MARKPAGGVLDLSELGAAPQKVKLPDGKLYSMANPAELGVLPQQKVISRYGRAQVLMRKKNATEADVDEMLEMLLDVAEVVLPGAPREVVGRLSLNGLDKLIQAFLSASTDPKAAGGRAGAETTKATSAI